MRPPRLPGWYPDDSSPGSSRYWNGTEWSTALKWRTGLSAVSEVNGPDNRVPFPAAGRLVSAGFSMLRQNWWQLAVIQFASVILPGLVGRWLATSLDEPAVLPPPDGARVSLIDSVSVLLSLAVAVLWLLAAGMRASLALDFVDESRHQGGWERLSEAFHRLQHRLPGAAGWMILIAAAHRLLPTWNSVVAALRQNPGAVLIGLPIVVLLIAVRVRWVSFADLATVDRAGNPFARSRRVSEGYWWPVVAALAVLAAVSWAAPALAWRVLVGTLGVGGGWSASDVPFVGPETAATAGFMALTVVTQGISLGVKATLYRMANPASSA